MRDNKSSNPKIPASEIPRSEVASKMSLDEIRYSEAWEDHEILIEALDIQSEDDVLSIASGGSNVLALVLEQPRSITAIDMSVAQLALVELKIAGIKFFEYEDFLSLLGHKSGINPRKLYSSLRGHLGESARSFFDSNPTLLDEGLFGCGRLDRYIRHFNTQYLPGLWQRDLVKRLFECESVEEQKKLFYLDAFTDEFREKFAWYFGKQSMSSAGRDPAQFKYVEHKDVGAYFLERFENVVTTIPLRNNFYVERFLTGTYEDIQKGPLYIREENFMKLRGLVERVSLVHDEIERYLFANQEGMFNKANLSNIFEYMSTEAADRLFSVFASRFRGLGRLAYWNLLADRYPTYSKIPGIEPLKDLSMELASRDKAWFYKSFFVDQIL